MSLHPWRASGWLALLASGLLAACQPSAVAREEAVSILRLEVASGDFVEHLLLTGELVAEDSVALIAPEANLWPLQLRWLVEDGATLAAGETVAEFDSSSLLNQLEEARLRVVERATALASQRARTTAAIAQARWSVEQKRGEVEKTRLEVEVPRELRVAREHENFRLAFERATLELAAAERELGVRETAGRAEDELAALELEKARSEVRTAETTIERLILRAPRSGVVLVGESREQGRPYQPGDNVYPGEIVAEIPDLDTLVVEAQLFDVDDGRLALGMGVEATVDAFPERVFPGRVREIGAAAQQVGQTSQRRFFVVLLELEGLDARQLRPGMSIKGVVEVERRAGARLVPRVSLDLTTPNEPRLRLANGRAQEVGLGPCNAQLCVLEEGPAVGTALGGTP